MDDETRARALNDADIERCWERFVRFVRVRRLDVERGESAVGDGSSGGDEGGCGKASSAAAIQYTRDVTRTAIERVIVMIRACESVIEVNAGQ